MTLCNDSHQIRVRNHSLVRYVVFGVLARTPIANRHTGRWKCMQTRETVRRQRDQRPGGPSLLALAARRGACQVSHFCTFARPPIEIRQNGARPKAGPLGLVACTLSFWPLASRVELATPSAKASRRICGTRTKTAHRGARARRLAARFRSVCRH